MNGLGENVIGCRGGSTRRPGTLSKLLMVLKKLDTRDLQPDIGEMTNLHDGHTDDGVSTDDEWTLVQRINRKRVRSKKVRFKEQMLTFN